MQRPLTAVRSLDVRIAAVVQARMSSRRLPGKVLVNIHGKPLLQYVLERLGRCAAIDGVIVATSSDRSDDPVHRFCDKAGVSCVRGPLDNVAARFLGAIDAMGVEAFVRISGDSPLIDPHVVAGGIECFLAGPADVATNVVVRSFPVGQSVEVVNAESFRRAYPAMSEPRHFEHVTPFFYEHPDKFQVRSFTSPVAWQHVRLAVDTPLDLDVITRMIEMMKHPHWDVDLTSLVRLHGEITGTCSSCGSASSASGSVSST